MENLERGRDACVRRAWSKAYESLRAADRHGGLGGEDLERLATAAYMLGLEGDLTALERAYKRFLAEGEELRAVRCAFWLGMHLMLRGEMALGSGWLGRASRLLGRQGSERAEHGYLLLPVVKRHEANDDWEAADEVAGQAAEIGMRFDEGDLVALAVTDRYRFAVLQRDRRVPGGLRVAACRGVDRCAHALVEAPAGHGVVHRPLPLAPSRDPHVAGRVA